MVSVHSKLNEKSAQVYYKKSWIRSLVGTVKVGEVDD